MKVTIDYSLAKEHKGGMAVYVENIVKNLKAHDKTNTFSLITNPITFNKQNLFTKILSTFKQHLYYQTRLINDLESKNTDIFYSPNPPIPILYNKPIVVTIPDMSFYYDTTLTPLVRLYLLVVYFLTARKAKTITTFSKHSKKDICKLLKVSPQKVVVTPLAADKSFTPPKNKHAIAKKLKKLGISKNYILSSPGTFLPRKNLYDLVLAYHRLPKNIKLKNLLVLVGNTKDSHFENLKRKTKKLKGNKNIIFTGYVKKSQLLHLYQNAQVFVYPSLYEGFGLPLLEAMQCKVPIIAYNKTSLPEVAGKAGILVNNPSELTKALLKLFKNKKLKNKLAQEGLLRAKEFSWKKTAQKLSKIFNNFQTSI